MICIYMCVYNNEYVCIILEPTEMNGPDLVKMPVGGAPGTEGKDSVANGRTENESNPFAEYMWMENEEEYNRQVCMYTKLPAATP